MQNWNELNNRAGRLGFRFGSYLLPGPEIDPGTWAVIACDQHTSNPDYWRKVETTVGESPSTLRLVLPEVYLGTGTEEKRLSDIRKAMAGYLEGGLLRETGTSFIAIERGTPYVDGRRGLLVLLDLEQYDYHPESRLPARATEETLEHRLPPRMAIRREAAVEVSHVLVLLDDPKDTVIGPVFTALEGRRQTYHARLMQHGGELSGYVVEDTATAAGVVDALEAIALAGPERYQSEDPLLFAIGDGNHSLASAKKVWDEKKSSLSPEHPLRYVMVELVNSHDPNLNVQPIHRLVLGISPAELRGLIEEIESVSLAPDAAPSGAGGSGGLGFWDSEGSYRLVSESLSPTETGIRLQRRLEALERENPEVNVDYIHGAEETIRIAREQGGSAILYPEIDPKIVFETVAHHQVLPRKFFSLGESEEKRYYFECRRLDSR
jgi:hypothetical protein